MMKAKFNLGELVAFKNNLKVSFAVDSITMNKLGTRYNVYNVNSEVEGVHENHLVSCENTIDFKIGNKVFNEFYDIGKITEYAYTINQRVYVVQRKTANDNTLMSTDYELCETKSTK